MAKTKQLLNSVTLYVLVKHTHTHSGGNYLRIDRSDFDYKRRAGDLVGRCDAMKEMESGHTGSGCDNDESSSW